MNDNWLHKIHDRMADYEIEEPENLWTSIEDSLKSESAKQRPPRPSFISTHKKESFAAAAAIAIAISAGFYLLTDTPSYQKPNLSTSHLSETASSVSVRTIQQIEDLKPSLASKINQVVTVNNHSKPNQASKKSLTTDDTATKNLTESIKSEPSEEKTDNKPDSTVSKKIYVKDIPADDRKYTAYTSHTHSDKHGISFSVFSSGATGATDRGIFPAAASNAYGSAGSSWDDAPLLGILLFNQGRITESQISHRLPLRVGLSFSYSFNDRLGIETGITYTNLTSDIREGSEEHYIAGEQKLHYIGIPINLKYRIYTWKMFDFYASAGAAGDKCFSAKIDKEFIIDKMPKSSSAEKLSEKPMQWSVNAAVGIQCNVINSLSIFAEPGVSYYFNDGSSIKTIYKEKPLNFNLNLGIRYTIGK